jgi:hypothetical protein
MAMFSKRSEISPFEERRVGEGNWWCAACCRMRYEKATGGALLAVA